MRSMLWITCVWGSAGCVEQSRLFGGVAKRRWSSKMFGWDHLSAVENYCLCGWWAAATMWWWSAAGGSADSSCPVLYMLVSVPVDGC